MEQVTTSVELDPRWQLVLNRDTEADGTFVYAVKTTGVYCRPSCPSRRAKPQNVAFFKTENDAERAGFRECLSILAANPRLGKERPEFSPPVRIHHHAKHYIIYRIEEDALLIVRVLRDESDLTRHLGGASE